MNTPLKLSLFGLGLAAVFAASYGAGYLAGPSPATAPAGHQSTSHATHDTAGPQNSTAEVPGGLQVAQDGYRLQPLSTQLSTAQPQPLRFRILGPDGAPVTAYTPTHDKDLHLIVVRRDLAGFQHVHPTLGAGGVWEIPLHAGAGPGQYRLFADFQPTARSQGLTLGVDLPAPGAYQPAPLPAAARTATIDGYTVTLDGDLVPGTSSKLTLTVTKDGKPVTDLQPYLAAYGHLVALRDGDLAYLHVHPDGEPGDGRTTAGPQIVFHAEVPSAGAYRLFLDFQHNGVVRTAAFTAAAGTAAPAAPAPPSPTPAPSPTHGHGGH
ncbi:hypothetical protein [Catellatospora bangladeshensis]|uniref:Secreted protein n=1 Tax=Catellatospora bangladeshensis TaxID=310355 RepID=A0A8J3JC37_9ACTN|nr:hypothetical protein [Catellatospora bangladeshensis]GIF82127.1 hypothetical protein Cba03nite_34760 [Catellatospora bangladeshensis]